MELVRIRVFARSLPGQMIALVMLVALLLTGCGGGAPETAATAEPTVADSITVAPTTADAEATPTEEEAEPAEEPDAATPEEDAATDETMTEDGTVANDAGFTFMPPEGWQVATNVGEATAGVGTAMLVPAGVDPEAADAEGIIMVFGPSETILGAMDISTDLDEDTIDALLDQMMTDPESEDTDITIADREDITIGGNDGVAVSISGTDPDLGEVQGRVALALLEGERVFMMIGIGTEETWSLEDFEQVRESLDIAAATAPEETIE
jgi:hypothetical protein